MSNTSIAGWWQIDVSEGGWPVWVEIRHKGERLLRVDATELPDLEHAISRARIAARNGSCVSDKDREKF